MGGVWVMKDEKMPEPTSDGPQKKPSPLRSQDRGEDGDGVGRGEAEEGEERRV